VEQTGEDEGPRNRERDEHERQDELRRWLLTSTNTSMKRTAMAVPISRATSRLKERPIALIARTGPRPRVVPTVASARRVEACGDEPAAPVSMVSKCPPTRRRLSGKARTCTASEAMAMGSTRNGPSDATVGFQDAPTVRWAATAITPTATEHAAPTMSSPQDRAESVSNQMPSAATLHSATPERLRTIELDIVQLVPEEINFRPPHSSLCISDHFAT
jgi:hypothetical protein